MKLRHKITAVLSAAAVLAMICTAAVFAMPSEPRPDVVSQPKPMVTAKEATVYYTSKGVYYHNIEDCSGMLNAEPHTLSEAQNDGKIACPVCVQGKGETNWFIDQAEPTAEPTSYDGIITMDANGALLQAESRPVYATAEPTPSPMPIAEEAFSGWEAEEVMVYYTEQGKYHHYDEHCSGMMNAHAHTLTEAMQAGKETCPVCDISELTVENGPQPAERMCAVGMEYFMEIFDRGLLETFPNPDMEGSGKQTGDYLVEEAVYINPDGAYVAIYREMNANVPMSGRIVLMFPEGFDHDLFSGEGAAWYRNTYALAMETLVSMPMNSHINKLSDALTQVYVYFDGEIKPIVCELEFETDSGFFTLSFDIHGDEPSFATMNYNASRA